MSSYFQSLTLHLHGKGQLTDTIKNALLEHDDAFNSKPSVKMTWGVHKGKTLREIHAFKPFYIEWLCKQAYIKEKFQDIYEEAKQLLE
jgi:hypothetical protein